MRRRVTVRCKYTLGDVVVLTAAVRDLHRAFPGVFELSVDSGYPEVWLHNPWIKQHLSPGEIIDCKEAIIDRPGLTGQHYVQAYLDLLNRKLGVKAPLGAIKGDIHLSPEEKSWYSDIWSLCGREVPFWIICPGGKFDLPIKWWDQQRYQEVVDALRGKIQFVQVGQWGNHHPPLDGVIDLRGKTSVRDLIHLVHHADGVLCGVTSLMHLAAAVPERGFARKAIIVAGDREPRAWESYPGHIYLTSGEHLPCGNCWNHRVSIGKPAKGACHRVHNHLPECLDNISAAQVIEAFAMLQREGRLRLLSGREHSFARKAIDKAHRPNSFDSHNINDRNAAAKAAAFIATIPPYPTGRYRGRGILICAGGSGYFTQAWVCLRMLRQVGCTLPAEVWHFGPQELDARMEKLLAPLNARSVNARLRMKSHPMRNPLGWELKSYALLHSRFEEVLSLDADNVPIVDPTFLFDTPEFKRTGAIFWPDYKRLGPGRAIWRLTGVPYRDEPEFESGQMVIHKKTCWHAVNLAWWYNDHSEFFYKHVHGDKETFHFAWRRTGTEYSMPGFPIESLEGVMCQHDFQGRRIFQHRNLHKWSFFGENKRIAGFALEDDCRSHLDSLRHIWDGTIRGTRERRTFKDAQIRSDSSDREVLESVALWNEYHLPPILQGRDVILDIGAHIGSFTRACHDRGSRNIHAFEPHPENFHLLESNVGRLPGVHLHRAAMLGRRSHAKVGPFPMAQGKQNTGGAIVQESADGVPAYAIDEILKGLGYVTLLKLDCEGSEWSILAALTEWQRVAAICGEYHPRGFDSVALLAVWLRPRFRFVRIQNPNDEGLGKFWASHVKTFFSNGHLRKRQVFAQRSAARHDV